MSSVTVFLLMTPRSNVCRTSTGAGRQPRHRPQRGSGMTRKRYDKSSQICCRFLFKTVSLFAYVVPCSKLQSFLLQQQTFLEKCETWMEFLVQTEENLAVEISGNYQSLMEQQKTHEVVSLWYKKNSLGFFIALLYALISFFFLVIPSRDVQSAADPALYY